MDGMRLSARPVRLSFTSFSYLLSLRLGMVDESGGLEEQGAGFQVSLIVHAELRGTKSVW